MTHALSSLYGLPAPAKLNLFLHVTGRRPDGMHLLQSVFVMLGLCDTIDIERTDGGRIERAGDVIGPAEGDLCVRAAQLVKDTFGIRDGLRITVKKRIPAGAGMGGGSSDAATVLMALSRLFALGLSREALIALGVRLGADVPFFLFGQTAFAEGIGERLTPVFVPPSRYACIWPGKGVSTAAIFRSPNLTRDTKSVKIAVFSDAVHCAWPTLFGHNDLQPVAVGLEPRIAGALAMLAPCASPRMTGSGSAVFGIVKDAAYRLPELPGGWIGFIAESLERHPLAGWLGGEATGV